MECQIFAPRQFRIKWIRVPEVPDAGMQRLARSNGVKVQHPNRAPLGRHQTSKSVEQRTLARPVITEYENPFALAHVEVHLAQNSGRALTQVRFADMNRLRTSLGRHGWEDKVVSQMGGGAYPAP